MRQSLELKICRRSWRLLSPDFSGQMGVESCFGPARKSNRAIRPAGVILLAAALSIGCRKQEARTLAASEPPPVSAAIVVMAAQPFQAAIPITGTLVSNARVDVKAEVVGRITRFDKEEGARVAAGEAI